MRPDVLAVALIAAVIVGGIASALDRVGGEMLKGWSFGDEQ